MQALYDTIQHSHILHQRDEQQESTIETATCAGEIKANLG